MKPRGSPASGSKPLTNPTPAKATFYQYTCIALVVLIHLLDDQPRHIRYRETHGKGSSASAKHHDQNVPTSKTTRPRASDSPSLPPRGATPCRTETHPRRPPTPPQPRQQHFYREVPVRNKVPTKPNYVPMQQEPQLSRTQQSQAWSRMRSVTPST